MQLKCGGQTINISQSTQKTPLCNGLVGMLTQGARLWLQMLKQPDVVRNIHLIARFPTQLSSRHSSHRCYERQDHREMDHIRQSLSGFLLLLPTITIDVILEENIKCRRVWYTFPLSNFLYSLNSASEWAP